jgi:predicted alpha/beta hydrolase family esterase
VRYLNVPGYTNSGPGHWQTYVEDTYEGFSRVVQDDWEAGDRERWVANLDVTVRGIDDEVFLVGHSCGAVTVAQWAASRWDSRVVGALLVAPADVDAEDALPAIRGQRPLPQVELLVKTHVVVTDNDPYLALDRGLALAATWGATVEVVSGGGHLASADGFGPWDYITSVIARCSGGSMEIRKDA